MHDVRAEIIVAFSRHAVALITEPLTAPDAGDIDEQTDTVPDLNNEELMPRNNDDWFKAAYPKCIESLKKYLRRFVGSREEAEDLAHDAFLRVWAAPNFDRSRETQGYLFATARNLALDWNKAHHVAKSDFVGAVPEISDNRASVERDAMTAEEFQTLSKAMSRLPERRRDVLMLRAFFEYSCQEIADHLKISRTTVHRELAAAIGMIHAARKLIDAEKKRNGGAQVVALGRGTDAPS